MEPSIERLILSGFLPDTMEGNSLKNMSRNLNLEILSTTPPWQWPPDAARTLLTTLSDRKAGASDRRVAAELAGEIVVIDDKIADALLSVVRAADEPEDVRGRAAIALGPVLEMCDTEGFELDALDLPISERMFDRIRKTLRSVFDDAGVPKSVRRCVLEASVRAPQGWHADAIRAAYSSGDEEWKLTAVFCMEYVEGFESEILESLDSPNEDIHFQAVCAAGNWELDAAWDHIYRLVESESTEKELRLAAIEALPNIRADEAGELLVELTDSEDEELVEAAHGAMATAAARSDEEGDTGEDEDDFDDDLDDEDEDDLDEDELDEDEEEDEDEDEDDLDEDEDEFDEDEEELDEDEDQGDQQKPTPR